MELKELKVQRKGKTRVLKTHGNLTMEDADALKESLISCIDKSEEVLFDIDEIEDADLPCLELMCAAHKTAERSKKKFLINGRPSENLLDAIEDAGYCSRSACEWGKESCIWDEIQKRDNR
jgi:anti-anti-sigma regulatory factor